MKFRTIKANIFTKETAYVSEPEEFWDAVRNEKPLVKTLPNYGEERTGWIVKVYEDKGEVCDEYSTFDGWFIYSHNE